MIKRSCTIKYIFLLTGYFLIAVDGYMQESQHDSRPNIIILLADDLGYGDLGCYGNNEIITPNLDKLALEGVLFTDCYASAPMCSPSRAGLLTGKTPNRSGIYDWIPPDSSFYLRKQEITIAKLLRDHGYQTALFGKWHLNGKMGTDEQTQPDDMGFDYYFATQYSAHHLHPKGFYRNGEKLYQQHGYSCDIVTQDALKWLRTKHDTTKPFFLYLAFHEVHEPISSPPDLLVQYCKYGKKMVYYANVTNLDRAIGRFMDALKELDKYGNTFVFFTSDNGPATWTDNYFSRSYGSVGPLRGRKRYLWEGGIRVPGIMVWPGKIKKGQICDVPISNVDILPTFCNLAGIHVSETGRLDGTDISPLFSGEKIRRKIPLQWHFYAPVAGPNSVIRDGDWILTAKWNGGEYTRGRFRRSYQKDIKKARLTDFELYNIRKDIGQKVDLKNIYKDKFQAMKQEMIKLFDDVEKTSPYL
ncbi:MAG: sulfatase-like hydrolase/transferase [Bacteroidales bacterium]|nr:sulfatase-like hydrolase/transferase [Bacteroidales bacterium]